MSEDVTGGPKATGGGRTGASGDCAAEVSWPEVGVGGGSLAGPWVVPRVWLRVGWGGGGGGAPGGGRWVVPRV